jgi:predicted transcriptional regulator
MHEVTPQIIKSIMKATYNLADEENYNVYDAKDTAEYLGLPLETVEATFSLLLEAGMISECMSLHDDGVQTYCLTDRAIDLVETGNAKAG